MSQQADHSPTVIRFWMLGSCTFICVGELSNSVPSRILEKQNKTIKQREEDVLGVGTCFMMQVSTCYAAIPCVTVTDSDSGTCSLYKHFSNLLASKANLWESILPIMELMYGLFEKKYEKMLLGSIGCKWKPTPKYSKVNYLILLSKNTYEV